MQCALILKNNFICFLNSSLFTITSFAKEKISRKIFFLKIFFAYAYGEVLDLTITTHPINFANMTAKILPLKDKIMISFLILINFLKNK